MNVFWVLLVAGALTLGQMLLFKRAGLRGVRVDRRFSRTRLFEGDRIEMIETIENRRILPVPFLRIETRMPSELLFGKQENLEIGGQRYHRSGAVAARAGRASGARDTQGVLYLPFLRADGG